MDKKDILFGLVNGVIISFISLGTIGLTNWFAFALPFIITALEFIIIKKFTKHKKSWIFYTISILLPILLLIIFALSLPYGGI
jgi:hypothetical protein